jgi:hypothetical protein
MSASTDDTVIDEFFSTIKHDEQLKRQLAAALRAKDRAGVRQAVRWVVDNVIKPGIRSLRDGAVQQILDALGRALGALP